MRTFKDINHVSNTPKAWNTPNGRRIEWRSDRQSFDQFYAIIVEYHKANGFSEPARDAVIAEMCRQMPRWACVDEGYHSVSNYSPVVGRSGGCSSCGKKR
jgi:hypothetical protein